MTILFFLSKTSKNPNLSFTALVILNKNFLDRAQAFPNQDEPHLAPLLMHCMPPQYFTMQHAAQPETSYRRQSRNSAQVADASFCLVAAVMTSR